MNHLSRFRKSGLPKVYHLFSLHIIISREIMKLRRLTDYSISKTFWPITKICPFETFSQQILFPKNFISQQMHLLAVNIFSSYTWAKKKTIQSQDMEKKYTMYHLSENCISVNSCKTSMLWPSQNFLLYKCSTLN